VFEAKMGKRRGVTQAFNAQDKSLDFGAAMEKESAERGKRLFVSLALVLHFVPLSNIF